MALPTPGWNVVFGEIPAASKWTQLGQNDDALAAGTGLNAGVIGDVAIAAGGLKTTKFSNPYKFHAYHNTTQSVAANAKMSYNTKDFDTGSNFDNTTNFRFTAPVAGFYFFDAAVYFQGVTAGSIVALDYYKNGISYARAAFALGKGDDLDLHGSMLISLAANDYIEVFRGGTGTFTAYGQSAAPAHGFNYFAGYLLSAT